MNNPSKAVMMISGKNDERIATQQKPDQGFYAGIQISFTRLEDLRF
jgi:hypothetical protein